MLEISLDTMAVDADAPDEAALQNGAPPQVIVQVIGGTVLPIADPSTRRPLRFPSHAVNFALTKETALELADLIKAKAETLPSSPSGKLVTATSLDEVEQVADITKRFR